MRSINISQHQPTGPHSAGAVRLIRIWSMQNYNPYCQATAREERRGGGKETATAVLSDSETILLSLSFRSAVCSVEVEEGGKLMKPTDVSGEALVFDAKRG